MTLLQLSFSTDIIFPKSIYIKQYVVYQIAPDKSYLIITTAIPDLVWLDLFIQRFLIIFKYNLLFKVKMNLKFSQKIFFLNFIFYKIIITQMKNLEGFYVQVKDCLFKTLCYFNHYHLFSNHLICSDFSENHEQCPCQRQPPFKYCRMDRLI